jgi:acetylornithine/succinyldiaminopimelate/putrescine aminotransferase
MTTQELIAASGKYLANTYARFPIVLVRGRGVHLWDSDGKDYLDFVGGIAVDALGHCHPKMVEAIRAQAETLIHVSNLYHIEPQIHLGKLLCEQSFADRAFFCNSGAEANEAAIKLARKYAKDHWSSDRVEIIAMHHAFHGRTLATVTATGNPSTCTASNRSYRVSSTCRTTISAPWAGHRLADVCRPGGARAGRGRGEHSGDAYLPGCAACATGGHPADPGRCGRGWGGPGGCSPSTGVWNPDILTWPGAGRRRAAGAMLPGRPWRQFRPGTHASTFGGTPSCRPSLAVVRTMLDDLPGNAARVKSSSTAWRD